MARVPSPVRPTPIETPCVLWEGPTNAAGYGIVNKRTKRYRAHRVAWAEVNGPIPDGMIVMHRCDNPPCVNIEHLRLGTKADNAADAAAKGRVARNRGEAAGRAVLTAEQVRTMRDDTTTGTNEWARRFGVHSSTASRARRGVRWGEL